MTDDQRVAICASYYVKANPRGAPRGNINNKPAAKSQLDRTDQLTSSQGATRKRLATKAGVSERKAGQGLKVVRKNPALAKRVSSGELRLHEAEKAVDKAEAVGKVATPPAVPQARVNAPTSFTTPFHASARYSRPRRGDAWIPKHWSGCVRRSPG